MLETDEGKVAQVLRNLVSNALKFTERGEVRVRGADRGDDRSRFRVTDTGIGIAPEDLERVFEEFTQVESPLQRRCKGTGLGLPLSRKLAELLGGTLTRRERARRGSTFTLTIPRVHPEVREMSGSTSAAAPTRARAGARRRGRPPDAVPLREVPRDGRLPGRARRARSTRRARASLETSGPRPSCSTSCSRARRPGTSSPSSSATRATRDIPVLVVTVTDREQKARALGADEFWLKPVDHDWLLRKLQSLRPGRRRPTQVLVIDDDEGALPRPQAARRTRPTSCSRPRPGREASRSRASERRHVIFLDFVLEDMTAFDVLDELKADPRTRGIPVIIHTSHELDASERERLPPRPRPSCQAEPLARGGASPASATRCQERRRCTRRCRQP